MNKKFSFLSIVIIVCVIAVALVGAIYFFTKNNNSENIAKQEKNNEAEELEKNNQSILNNAQNNSIETVQEINDEDHIWGDLSAPVQIIVYSDFECPFCARFYETSKEIKKEFGEQVVIAFRHYPLVSHYNAIPAAIASECAAEQDKFWEMHDKLYETSQISGLSTEIYQSLAKDLSLDVVEFSKCLHEERYKDKVLAQKITGKNAGATGSPTVFVNKEILPGAYPFENYKDQSGKEKEGMKSIINRHLAK